jgi:hypothetical protein
MIQITGVKIHEDKTAEWTMFTHTHEEFQALNNFLAEYNKKVKK